MMRLDGSAFQEGKFGIPILFPTPSRVRNGVFKFNGRKYELIKNGKPLLIHGLVRDEPWKYKECETEENYAKVTTYIEVNEEHPIYESFPFNYKIQLTYILKNSGFSIEYEIENFDKNDLPFGFGLHPYFAKIGNLDKIFIQVPAKYVMESIDLMPTGEIKKVQDTKYDLVRSKPLGMLDINDIYWKMDSILCGTIIYQDLKRKLVLQASDDFTHMVVYTPHDRSCFCLENQTCSADAHNLYDKGKKDISGLIILRPGETHKGWVRFAHYYI